MIGLGIDTGGTCTDAVIFDLQENRVLDTAKTLTTKAHLESGIGNALDLLDPDLLKQAEFVSLSTTLATNACVENRGGKVKLLLIGVNRKVLQKTYKDYGFESTEDIILMDGMPEGGFMTPVEPDWESLREQLDAFAGAEAIGIVQSFPEWNHGAFEKRAAEILRERYEVPVVCGSELFSDLNALRRGAGTYLNSRLIPVIRAFLKAVKEVTRARGLHVPIFVVRSDGTLMNEAFTETHPVETLLCGPAASALGGAWMAGEDNALIVDIGGTTTDVAIMQNGRALTVDGGIRINGWKTFVKGMYIDTFGLGGDSAVRFDAHGIYLEPFRVIPVSMLAAECPEVKERIAELQQMRSLDAPFPYEGFILQKEDYDPEQLQSWQVRFLEALKEGPMTTEAARDSFGSYAIDHDMESLERQNIVMRFGLTPTDMMHLKGDFTQYDTRAAEMAAGILAKCSHIPVEELPDLVYRAFVKKLAVNLQRILIEKGTGRYPDGVPGEVRALLSLIYEKNDHAFLETDFRCRLPVIGVGGPAGVFIPPTAEKLQTSAFIHRYAGVANAIGTLTGKVTVTCSRELVMTYEDHQKRYRVFINGEKRLIRDYDEAKAVLKEALQKEAAEKARSRGIQGELAFQDEIDEKMGRIGSDRMLIRAVMTVSATGSMF